MLDSEDIWNIHSIGLPYYFPDSGTFQLNTAVDRYPIASRSREKTNQLRTVLEEISRGDVGGAYALEVPE